MRGRNKILTFSKDSPQFYTESDSWVCVARTKYNLGYASSSQDRKSPKIEDSIFLNLDNLFIARQQMFKGESLYYIPDEYRESYKDELLTSNLAEDLLQEVKRMEIIYLKLKNIVDRLKIEIEIQNNNNNNYNNKNSKDLLLFFVRDLLQKV